MTSRTQVLDPELRSLESQEFDSALRARIVGQEEAPSAPSPTFIKFSRPE